MRHSRAEVNGRVAELLIRAASAPIARAADTLATLCTYAQGIGSAAISTDGGERHAADLVRQRVKGPLVVFDVGANVGNWTSGLLAVCAGSASVHCFEPAPASYRELERRYRSAPTVQTWNLGLSDSDGPAELFSDSPMSVVASLYPGSLETAGSRAASSTTIRLTTVDRFCAREEIERIDFLKIDVEGGELAVLRGAQRFLDERRIRFVQFEFGYAALHAGTHLQSFYAALADFDIYRVVPRGLIPLGSYRPRLENFVSATNYLAVARTA